MPLDAVPIDEALNLYAKVPALVEQWNSPKLHPLVKKIAIVAAQYQAWHGRQCVITSIHRSDGIHSDWRAIDMRCRSTEFDIARKTEAFKEDEEIRKKLNTRFPRFLSADGKKQLDTVPPLDHAGNARKSNAPHFHIQVDSRAPRGGGGAK